MRKDQSKMATMKVEVTGGVACFVATREDGAKLSLSSLDNSLCLFDKTGKLLKDFGAGYDADNFAYRLSVFCAGYANGGKRRM
jgi:hypothetical protein